MELPACDSGISHKMAAVNLVSYDQQWYSTNSQSGRLPDGSIAQLVEHCTSIADVTGSNPVQAWILFSQLLKLYA